MLHLLSMHYLISLFSYLNINIPIFTILDEPQIKQIQDSDVEMKPSASVNELETLPVPMLLNISIRPKNTWELENHHDPKLSENCQENISCHELIHT